VSKKSRSERRKAQLQRSVTRGDPSVLRMLADRGAETGAKALFQAITASPSVVEDPQVMDLAAGVCERLRGEDRFDTALKLASAFRRATPRLALEEALAAFGMGDDARALEAAGSNRELELFLAPVLAVARGGRVPNNPPGAPAMWRGITALARCVAGVREGRSSSALAALRQVPEEAASRLFASEMRLVADILSAQGQKLVSAAIAFAQRSVFWKSSRVANALAQCLATRYPRLFIDTLAARIPFPPDIKADALLRASVAAAGLDSVEARVSLLIAKLGHAAFPKEQQGLAALYEGFAFCMSDPRRALRSFDRAVELGADLNEALRGRLLVQVKQFDTAMAAGDWAADYGRAAASTALRLHRAMSHSVETLPVAVVAAERAARMLSTDRDRREEALEAVRAARAAAQRAGLLTRSLEADLLFDEAAALRFVEPARALELVEQVIAREPRHHEAWHLRIDLTMGAKGPGASEDWILAAGEMDLCEELTEEAAVIRARRGLPARLVPGKTGAGELARELKRRRDAGAWPAPPAAYDPDVAACREALDAQGRSALDAAAFVLLRERGQDEGGLAIMRLVAAEDDGRGDTWMLLVALAAVLGWEGSVFEIVRASAPAVKQRVAMEAITCYMAESQPAAAKKLVVGIASEVTASVLRALKKQLGVSAPTPGSGLMPEGYRLIAQALQRLAPHFEFPDGVQSAVGRWVGDPEFPVDGSLLPPGLLDELERFLPRALSKFNSLPPDKREAFHREIGRLLAGPVSDEKMRELLSVLAEHGLQPED